MAAIGEAYKMPPGWTQTASAPFKSATKWSGASYGEHGNWVIGAPDVLLDPESPQAEQAEHIGALGLRVLLLGSSDLPSTTRTRPAPSPRRRWWCWSNESAPMLGTRWNTLPPSGSPSR